MLLLTRAVVNVLYVGEVALSVLVETHHTARLLNGLERRPWAH